MLLAAINPDASLRMGEFIQQFKPNYPVGMADPGVVANFSQFTPDMRPTVPIMFFIDRNFSIRAQFMGSDAIFNNGDMGANIRAEIEKLLNDRSPARVKK